MLKTGKGATSLLEEMPSNNYQWPTERIMAKKVAGIHELDLFAALSSGFNLDNPKNTTKCRICCSFKYDSSDE